MLLNDDVSKSCLAPHLCQLARLETLQNRKSAIFTYQAIVQEQPTYGPVKVISDRIAMKIYDKNSASSDPAHFAEELNRALIIEMVQRQR